MKYDNQELILKILSLEVVIDHHLWYNHFIRILPSFKINTALRISHFFAQVMHESLNLSDLEENFNYSKNNLLKIFPRYFNPKNVDIFYKNPAKIANRIYADRMGNGNEVSGDGYRFRGRGIIQLTGKNNYSNFNDFLIKDFGYKTDLITAPEILLQDISICILSACFFWQNNKLNILADSDNLPSLRKKINGGLIGLEDCSLRLARYKLLAF